jgi:mono/diheme cytochrome c family protein
MGWLSTVGIAAAAIIAAIVTVAVVAESTSNTDDSETAPSTTDSAPTTRDANRGAPPAAGVAVFADNCARCHGNDGGGGVGPQLSEGRVVARFASINDQIAFVTNTHSNITTAGNLSAEDIRAVVEYTRGL